MFLLAEKRMPAVSPSPDKEISPALRRTVLNLDPHPAFVLGPRWDYLAWNRAADYFWGISRMAPPYERNHIWQFFAHLDRGLQRPGWEQYTRGMLAEFRADAARHAGDPDQKLTLYAGSPDTAAKLARCLAETAPEDSRP